MGKKEFVRPEGAILGRTFDRRGERPSAGAVFTFAECLTQYRRTYVEQYRLTSNSLEPMLGVLEREFGGESVSALAANPVRFETWLQGQQAAKTWSDVTFNRYYELGRAI